MFSKPRKMSGLLALLAAAVLCFPLTACDTKPADQSDEPTPTTSAVTTEATTEDTSATTAGDTTSAEETTEPTTEPTVPAETTKADKPAATTTTSVRTHGATRTKPKPTEGPKATTLTFYAHNVCSHGDMGTSGGLGSVPGRLGAIKAQIAANDPDVFVLEECNMTWAKSIASSSGYTRAENTRTGQSEIQIFYKGDKLTLLEHSVDNSTRSAYHWAVFEVKATGEKVMVYGFHGDLKQEQRLAEVKAMLDTAAKKGLPTVYLGDFNADRECEEYTLMTAANDEAAISAASAFDMPTCPGWAKNGNSYIDHIFYTRAGFTADSYAVLDQTENGVVVSDHCALVAQLTLKG